MFPTFCLGETVDVDKWQNAAGCCMLHKIKRRGASPSRQTQHPEYANMGWVGRAAVSDADDFNLLPFK